MTADGDNSRESQRTSASARRLGRRLRLGWTVFLGLMAIEVGEYIVGVAMEHGAWPFLAALAIVGVWPILYYFMHISQLWQKHEEED